MRVVLLFFITGSVALLAVGSGRAGSMLSVTSSVNVNNLHVGDLVTFDVKISGIDLSDASTYLSYLAATVGYNSSLLSGGVHSNRGSRARRTRAGRFLQARLF